MIVDLYTNATTYVKLPLGKTDAVNININRGTIQGDSLSPFLFLIFMEPAEVAPVRGQRLPIWVPEAKHSWGPHNQRRGI